MRRVNTDFTQKLIDQMRQELDYKHETAESDRNRHNEKLRGDGRRKTYPS